jgi:hypothetical protein
MKAAFFKKDNGYLLGRDQDGRVEAFFPWLCEWEELE